MRGLISMAEEKRESNVPATSTPAAEQHIPLLIDITSEPDDCRVHMETLVPQLYPSVGPEHILDLASDWSSPGMLTPVSTSSRRPSIDEAVLPYHSSRLPASSSSHEKNGSPSISCTVPQSFIPSYQEFSLLTPIQKDQVLAALTNRITAMTAQHNQKVNSLTENLHKLESTIKTYEFTLNETMDSLHTLDYQFSEQKASLEKWHWETLANIERETVLHEFDLHEYYQQIEAQLLAENLELDTIVERQAADLNKCVDHHEAYSCEVERKQEAYNHEQAILQLELEHTVELDTLKYLHETQLAEVKAEEEGLRKQLEEVMRGQDEEWRQRIEQERLRWQEEYNLAREEDAQRRQELEEEVHELEEKVDKLGNESERLKKELAMEWEKALERTAKQKEFESSIADLVSAKEKVQAEVDEITTKYKTERDKWLRQRLEYGLRLWTAGQYKVKFAALLQTLKEGGMPTLENGGVDVNEEVAEYMRQMKLDKEEHEKTQKELAEITTDYQVHLEQWETEKAVLREQRQAAAEWQVKYENIEEVIKTAVLEQEVDPDTDIRHEVERYMKDLKSQKEILQWEKAAWGAEKEILLSEKSNLENEKTAIEEQMRDLQSDKESLQGQNTTLEEEKRGLLSEKEVLEAEKSVLLAKESSWEMEKKTQETEKTALQEKVRELEVSNQALQDSVNEIRTVFALEKEELQKDHQRQSEKIEQDYMKEKKENKEVEETHKREEEKLRSLVGQLENQINTTLRPENEKLQSKVVYLNEKVQTLSRENEKHVGDFKDLSCKYKTMESDLRNVGEHCGILKSKNADTAEWRKDVLEVIKSYKESVLLLDTENKELKQQSITHLKESKDKTAEISELQRLTIVWKRALSKSEKSVKLLQDKIASLEADSADRERKIARRVEKYEGMLKDLTASGREMEDAKICLQAENDMLKQEKEVLQTEVKKYKARDESDAKRRISAGKSSSSSSIPLRYPMILSYPQTAASTTAKISSPGNGSGSSLGVKRRGETMYKNMYERT